VAADNLTAALVAKLRRYTKGPLLCKPNAGVPTIGMDNQAHYAMGPEEFAAIVRDCAGMGAKLLGGCCGTTPAHITALNQTVNI